jgi:hypothetical protein
MPKIHIAAIKKLIILKFYKGGKYHGYLSNCTMRSPESYFVAQSVKVEGSVARMLIKDVSAG